MYRLLVVIAFIGSVAWFATNPGFEPGIACVLSFAAIFRDELHGMVGARIFSLTPRSRLVRNMTHARYSFTQSELINPRILADLSGWISDIGDQIVAVNVTESNRSNRYFGEVETSPAEKHPKVSATYEGSTFSYQYLGCSFSGVHLLRTWCSGGGKGVFCSILLVTLGVDAAVEVGVDGTKKVERFIVKKVASVPLGDRYQGRIRYALGVLSIGACSGMRSLRTKSQHLVVL